MRRWPGLFATLLLTSCFYKPAERGKCTPDTCVTEPICGDGYCNDRYESWQSCPADCPEPSLVETCNGKDDDGDGQVDEGDPGGGDSCGTGRPGACATGVQHCQGGALACVAPQPSAETCNGKDDNCDGRIDENDPGGGAACDTRKPGICAAGVMHCDGGVLSCVEQQQPAKEVCNGLDDDCNGKVDEVCESPPPTTLRLPMNGAYTGSAGATTSKSRPLRPTFEWDPVAGATGYQLQLDDSCTPGAIASCSFPSPEVDVLQQSTTWIPAANLPVHATPPVGTLYAWRVRTCHALACSAWSAIRYVRVGRMANDYDGNGIGDILEIDGGYLNYPGAIKDDPVAVAPAGDVNGDGYADVLLTVTSPQPAVKILLGGAKGLTLGATLSAPATMDAPFGAALAGAGDVNGDGLDDVAVGSPGATTGHSGGVYLYLATGTSSVVSVPKIEWGSDQGNLGSAVLLADVDGDGFADLVAGEPGSENNVGNVQIFLGSAEGLSAVVADKLANPDHSSLNMGRALAACDLDHDGRAEIVASSASPVAAPWTSGFPGRAYVFSGSPGNFTASPLADPQGGTFGYGLSLATGDFDGDGWCDVAVGSPDQTSPGQAVPDANGMVDVFMGGPSGLVSGPLQDAGPASIRGTAFHFGQSLAAVDDQGLGAASLFVAAGPMNGLVYTIIDRWSSNGFGSNGWGFRQGDSIRIALNATGHARSDARRRICAL